jgi:hypothetical protein
VPEATFSKPNKVTCLYRNNEVRGAFVFALCPFLYSVVHYSYYSHVRIRSVYFCHFLEKRNPVSASFIMALTLILHVKWYTNHSDFIEITRYLAECPCFGLGFAVSL